MSGEAVKRLVDPAAIHALVQTLAPKISEGARVTNVFIDGDRIQARIRLHGHAQAFEVFEFPEPMSMKDGTLPVFESRPAHVQHPRREWSVFGGIGVGIVIALVPAPVMSVLLDLTTPVATALGAAGGVLGAVVAIASWRRGGR